MMNLINLHNHNNNSTNSSGNFSERMQRTQEYIDALEEERRKIQVFQRELPLCLELVTQGTTISFYILISLISSMFFPEFLCGFSLGRL